MASKLSTDSTATALVAGDMNVGESDQKKNGYRLAEDNFSISAGDLYDDTHAIFSTGLIG